MTDKVLPPGDYTVRLHVVGSADVDGNILFMRWTIPATPALLAQAAMKGLEVLTPRHLERITAGSWLLVGIDWNVGADGCAVAEQIAVTGDVDRSDFQMLLSLEIPQAVELLARQMLKHIGIEPIDYHAPPHARPKHLN
jgi:hypothetical protein